MKKVIEILLYIWQLPQNLLGLLVKLLYRENSALTYKGKHIAVCLSFPGGISLGNTVIVNKYPFNKSAWNDVKHEWGHTKQSLYLGPLYLIVIGIPSIVWAALQGWLVKKDYYSFYTEKWADKLGNVKR